MITRLTILGSPLLVPGCCTALAHELAISDVAEESARNPDVKRLNDPRRRFRDNYTLWQQFSFLQ